MPPFSPALLGSFPERVLHNRKVVHVLACHAVVQTEANHVGNSSVHSSDICLFFADFFVQIKERKLGHLGVHGGELAIGLTSDAGFFISVGKSIELNNFANKNAGRVSGVGAFIELGSKVTYRRIGW